MAWAVARRDAGSEFTTRVSIGFPFRPIRTLRRGRACVPVMKRAPVNHGSDASLLAIVWLKGSLVPAAWAASHTNNSYLASQYRRLMDAAARNAL